MIEFTDGITCYKLSRGKILPKDYFSAHLQELYEKHTATADIPDSDLDFILSLGLTVLKNRPPKYHPDRIY